LQKKSSLQRAGALFLALIFTTVWAVNSLHDFFLHHEHPVCEESYAGSKGVHIHDERYEAHGCSLCALLLSPPALVALLSLPALHAKLPDSESPNFYHTLLHSKTVCDSVLLRGPPVL